MAEETKTTAAPGDVRNALSWAVAELVQAGVESPRLTAELLMASVLNWDRVRVIAHENDGLKEGAFPAFASLIRRRAGGEPLQYLTGEQEFFGLRMRITPAVLIPRPETEILVERAIGLAPPRAGRRLRFVDVGTGSGCIAIAFAHAVPHAVGWGVDLSPDALVVAQRNANRHGVGGRVKFVCADFLESVVSRPCFDLILSNPPYVARKDAGRLSVSVRDHEPHLALYAGNSGMDAYSRLVPSASRRLLPGGRLLMEVGAGMSGEVSRLVREEGLILEGVEPDLQGIPRCLIARREHG